MAFSDEVVEISDEEATISPQKAILRLDDLSPGPKTACYTQRQRRNHRRAVLWRLLRTAPWRSVREHGGLRGKNDPSASLTSEPTAVLMAASTEPGSAFLCHNARPLNSSALQTEKEQGYNASKCTYTLSSFATNAAADRPAQGSHSSHFGRVNTVSKQENPSKPSCIGEKLTDQTITLPINMQAILEKARKSWINPQNQQIRNLPGMHPLVVDQVDKLIRPNDSQ